MKKLTLAVLAFALLFVATPLAQAGSARPGHHHRHHRHYHHRHR